MYITLITIVAGIARGSGFLFDENTTPLNAGGSSLSDKHYVTVIDMIQEEKQARHQMEYYMTQLKEKIVENQNRTQNLETKVDQLTPKNDTVKSGNEIQLLKNITNFLLQEYRTLDTNYNELQQNYSEILKENNQIMQGWNSMAQQLTSMRQELEGLKGLQAINQLQDVKNLQNEYSLLQQKLQMTNNRLDSLTTTQQARGQDFIALYNKAQTMENDLIQVAIQQNTTFSQLKQEIQQDKYKTEEEIHQILINQSRALSSLQKSVDANSKKVAITSCSNAVTVSPNVPMLFPTIVTSQGIDNLAAFKSSGAFTCEIPGLYLVSLSVMSTTEDSFFHVYKNSEYLVDVYINYHSGSGYLTGTALVVVQLDVNDKVTIKPARSTFVFDYNDRHNTCLTVLKVK